MIDQFDFKPYGFGWATMTFVSHTKEQVDMTISRYWNEPLPELIDALCRLLNGGSRFEVVDTEGDNYNFTLILSEVIPGLIRIEVLENAYFDVLDTLEDRVPLAIFSAYDDIPTFCATIVDGLERLVEEMGLEQYKEKWGTDFPVEKLAMLKEAIRELNRSK